MGYGQGALIRGAVDGFRQHERDVQNRENHEDNRATRAMQRERMKGQMDDEAKVRTRRDAYEKDPAITGAADAVSYYRAKRDKALQIGDTAEFERVNAKLTEEEQKVFTRDYDRAMRRFIGSQGADYQGLADVYNKHWSDGVSLDMVRNEDGSYTMTFSREGEEPVTQEAKNWEDVGRVAMRMSDPKSWLAMKDAEAKELLKGRIKNEEIAARGDEDRKTARVRGEEARKTTQLRAGAGGKGVAGDPAAVRTAKWQIDQLVKNGMTEQEATQIVLKANRGDVTAKDKLRHLGALRRGAIPGQDGNVEEQLEKDVATAGGKAPSVKTGDPLGLRK